MDSVAEWVANNKENIEKATEIMGKAAGVLASTVGQFHPILEAVFVATSEFLTNSESKEARYLAEQFGKVNEKLGKIENEVDEIVLELLRSHLNRLNKDLENNIDAQYDKFQDFIKAKPDYKEKKKTKFITQYENTDRELNISTLYSHVIGEGFGLTPMMEMVVQIQKRDRKKVEEFCVELKKLFVKGIIAVLAYTSFTEGKVGEEIVNKWKIRMEDVETRMKEAVDDCIENFAEQAKEDMKNLTESTDKVSQEFVKNHLAFLSNKYYWVKWSIRAFDDGEDFILIRWLFGNKHDGTEGTNCFEFLTRNKVKVVISFCVDPKPLDRDQVQKKIEEEKIKGNVMKVAQSLQKIFPDFLIHTVNRRVEEVNNFPKDCYYFDKPKHVYVCLHSE